MSLARFRVDPSRVRVSIRRHGDGRFVVTVAERTEETGGTEFRCVIGIVRDVAVAGRSAVGVHRVARSAVYRALLAARAAGIAGVDLGMEGAYSHPHGRGRSWMQHQRLN